MVLDGRLEVFGTKWEFDPAVRLAQEADRELLEHEIELTLLVVWALAESHACGRALS